MPFSWQKVAESATKQELYDSWKLEIYQWLDTTPGSVISINLKSDFRLKRGSSSAKNKFNRIMNTTVDFEIIDTDKELLNLLRSDEEYNFMGAIYKNGSKFFAGYPTKLLDKFPYYQRDNLPHTITLYDGLNRLKSFDDLSQLGTGLKQLKEILRTIFNALNLILNINAYQNIYAGSDEDDTDARALWLEYYKIEDLINTLGENATYYDVLKFFADEYDWNIFQHEAIWVLRQNVSIINSVSGNNIWKETVNYSTGAYTSALVDLDFAVANTAFRSEPEVYQADKIDKVEFNINSHYSSEAPVIQNETNELAWVNPFFNLGNSGWTVDSGSPVFKNDSVYMNNGDQISQQSGDILSGETIKVHLSVTCIRMVLDSGDALNLWTDNPIARIKYIGSSNTYYWQFSGTPIEWRPTADSSTLIGFFMRGVSTDGFTTYLEQYDKATFEYEEDIVMPAEDGNLVIELYGGGVASGNNYPFEQGAIFHFCSVRRIVEGSQLTQIPWKGLLGDKENKLKYYSQVSNYKKVQSFNLPFADYNPFNGATIWKRVKASGVVNYLRADSWEPDDKLLLTSIAERIIKQNQSGKGYDIKLLPGNDLSFINLMEADLESEGSNSYYLPVYEEAMLIRDHRRFVVLKHNMDSPTITSQTEFLFPNS